VTPRRLSSRPRAMQPSSRLSAVQLLLGLILCGCLAPSAAIDCPAVTGERLMHGGSSEVYLAMSPEQVRAIVAIGSAAGGPQLCSGVFLARSWVLTAAHCLQITEPEVRVGSGDSGATLPVLSHRRHPTRDLALLEVDAEAVSSRVSPLAASSGAAPVPLLIGSAVEVAGYGLTETQGIGELRFLVEPITDLTNGSITVDGFGQSGACIGDSGGPMLKRGPDGSVTVVGILSMGADSCIDQDSYVDLAPASRWLASVMGATATDRPGCGSFTSEGRCFDHLAIWCDSGELVSRACAGDLNCGWDRQALGFRCVPPKSDPCAGADSFGRCRDDSAVRCVAGELTAVDCGPCGTCGFDRETGEAACGAALPSHTR
jgi:trypsin